MRIGIIGAGRIGGNVARQLARAGHEPKLSFARDQDKLRSLAVELGEGVELGTPREAAEFGDVVVVSVPWDALPEALEQTGSLEGRIVVDTTNQFGSGPKPAEGQTAAAFNAARMPGARYTKSFNSLTSAFQEETADRQATSGSCSGSAATARTRNASSRASSRMPATCRSTSAAPPAAPSWRRVAGKAP